MAVKEEFDATVKEARVDFVGFGNPNAYLAAKFRYLKVEIWKWKKKIEKDEK